MQINVEQVLRTYGISFRTDAKGYKVTCPFHIDSNPSGNINAEGYFRCWSCSKSTTIFKFLAQVRGVPSRSIFADLAKDGHTTVENPIDPQDVERAHVALFKRKDFLDELAKRCVTQDLITQYRLGVYADRISIPITNKITEFVNLRLYLPGAQSAKFLNLSGKYRSKDRLFPVDQLEYDRIMLCGGELKAIVAADELNKFDIGAISNTGSEESWDLALSPEFKGKTVYVCYDVDESGKKNAELRCRMLRHVAKEIYKIELPLDKEKYPKGDINDYKFLGLNLIDLIEKAVPWELDVRTDIIKDEEPLDVTLDQAVAASNAKRKIRLNAIVSSMDTVPYSIPKDIEVKCQRDQEFCAICPVYLNCKPESQMCEINNESIHVMEMVGQDVKRQQYTIQRAIGIPSLCQVCTFVPHSFYHVEDVRVSPPIDLQSRTTSEKTMQIAYFVGEQSLEVNESYQLVGRMHPHPANQQAALLINKHEPLKDALSSYVPESVDQLTIFQPRDWTLESLTQKLEHIYEDISANVTRVHRRTNMHVAVDLAYHSPLFLDFDGRKEKGWTEILLIGDSAMAKTQLITAIMQHYGLGDRMEGKNATVAGLLGGLLQFGKRWFITWGKIPTNDKRLLVIEELKGTSIEVISKLTDMRSSGIAEITKIEKRRTAARTRLLIATNPRSENPVSSYGSGIEIIRELIGNPEDIRRFDMCIIVEKSEVDVDQVNRLKPNVPHTYTSALCRELILYCWTVEKVKFESETYLLDVSKSMCEKYTDEIPIVDRGSFRLKLARLSAALAGRTFSILGDDTLYVRNCHVEYIASYLNSCYDTSAFGYNMYSKRVNTANKLARKDEIAEWLNQKTPYPEHIVESLMLTEDLDLQFFRDTCNWGHNEAQAMLSMLTRNRAIKRVGRVYRKTPEFLEFLKDFKITSPTLPNYLKQGVDF